MTYNQEDKTLEIILGESREITVNTSSPRQLKRKAVYSDASSHQPIYMHHKVWNHLWKYSKDNQNREVGGVLVGKTVIDSGVSVLEVTGFIEGRHMKEGFSSLTFTHETWNDINVRRKEEYPDKKIVGWFHTHPGHGIFLSRYDLFIHQNFFPGKDQIAVVFDPLRTLCGFFAWEADQVRQSHNVFIFVYSNENFDQDVRNLPRVVNKSQHNNSEVKPYIDVDVDMQEVTEEEHQGNTFLEKLKTEMAKQEEFDSISSDFSDKILIFPNEFADEELKAAQSTDSDDKIPDTASVDLSPTGPEVKIDYSGKMSLSRGNSSSKLDTIREQRNEKFQEFAQEINEFSKPQGKPEMDKTDKS
ncbi:MAG TPA: hypothetical protein GXX58_05800 [Gelria sp.]|nr:hypothetical protein [Gelria sp.]